MSEKEALELIEHELSALLASAGWNEALLGNDNWDLTEWVGPRIHKALDAARIALGEAPAR